MLKYLAKGHKGLKPTLCRSEKPKLQSGALPESVRKFFIRLSELTICLVFRFFFVCDRWLAVEKEDGAVERVIPVATRSDLTQFGKLFYTSSRKDLFDGHIWFSLFSRPTRSTFNRVQRLSCCLCLLYLSMIASAMFYVGQGEERENQSVLRLGPMTFTLQEFYVGFISAMIVVPVNIIIVADKGHAAAVIGKCN